VVGLEYPAAAFAFETGRTALRPLTDNLRTFAASP
jgi:hypothetical protein